jgi:hypothetical protein
MLGTIVLSVVLPTVAAALLLALGHAVWSRSAPVARGRWSLALAGTCGLWLAYVTVKSAPTFPPVDANEWALWLALVAALYGVLEAAAPLPTAVRWVARVLVSAAVPWLILRPLREHSFTPSESNLWLASATGVIVVVWSALEAAVDRLQGHAAALALTVLVGATAAALGLSGTALLAQTTGGLAAALGVTVALGWLRPGLSLARSAVPAVAVSLGSVWVAGHHYASLPLVSIGCFATLALALFAVRNLASSSATFWRAALVAAAVSTLFAGAGAGWAAKASAEKNSAAAAEGSPGANEEYDPDYGY